MLFKRNNHQFSSKGLQIKTQQKGLLKNVCLEGENNERLSRIPKWTRMFCMDPIKEQLLKHLFALNVETDPKP